MSKRNTVPTSMLCASALATLCLLAVGITAQNSTTGVPLKNIDIKVGKNAGGTAAKRTTGADGKVDLSDFEPGSYYLIVIGPSNPPTAPKGRAAAVPGGTIPSNADGGNTDNYLVEIKGAVGEPIKAEWNGRLGMFAKGVAKVGARTTTVPAVYEDKIIFDIGPRTNPLTPVFITIVKSKSNITNN